jgi:glycosyltransferase involved in cell wall biosynthesis
VEHVAEGLAHSSHNVRFFASEYLEQANQYLQNNPKLSGMRIKTNQTFRAQALTNCHDWFTRKEKSALKRHYEGRDTSALAGKMYRKLLYSVHGMLPINRQERVQTDARILQQAEIFHSPFGEISTYVRNYPKLKFFLTVYDLIPILLPQFVDYQSTAWTKRAIDNLKPDDWVFAISQATKNDLCAYRKDIHPDRVKVIHLAAARDKFYPCHNPALIKQVRRKVGLPPGARYILGLSTLAPHKNFERLIRCFGKVVEQEKLRDVYLVLVGTKGYEAQKIISLAGSQATLQNRVLFTGRLEDSDLAPLYSDALAFGYLSYYEGFGLPPLEAMQCGVPVITSNTSSLPEVVGDAGIMVSPEDDDAICQAILSIHNNSDLRGKLHGRSLNRAKQFSWERCVEEVLTGYQEALA